MKLILASASPRRLALLKDIGITPDEVVPADIDETPLRKENPKSFAIRLAHEKAAVIAASYPDAVVLGSDTVVACGQKILHKADTDEDVARYLDVLSGRRHHVFTAVSLALPAGQFVQKCSDSIVKFKQLEAREFADYVSCGEGIGKAGGYAIQGKAASLIKEISGSYSGIVGLPLYETTQLLKQTGYKW